MKNIRLFPKITFTNFHKEQRIKKEFNMQEKIEIESIKCANDAFCLEILYTQCGDREMIVVRKDALLAMLAVAEKEQIDDCYYQRRDAFVMETKA